MSQAENRILLENRSNLTAFEKDIIRVLENTREAMGDSVIVRIVGGWVRDKILGRESSDIDITVQGCTCMEFAEAMKTVHSDRATKLFLIPKNAAQGKHHETARVCVDSNNWVDISNLTSYDHKETECTPEEDAYNRDFSVNSLFFNLTTNEVEDFANGIEDLQNKVLRTAYIPEITLGNDPLRIVRGARLISQFNFVADLSFIEGSQAQEHKFKKLVTRERVGVEIVKLLESSNLLKGLEFLIQANCFGNVFDPLSIWHLDGKKAINRLEGLIQRLDADKDLTLLVVSIYLPLVDAPPVVSKEHSYKKIKAIDYAISNVLKLPRQVTKDAELMFKGIQMLSYPGLSLTRESLGMFVRDVGPLWRSLGAVIDNEELKHQFETIFVPFIIREHLEEAYTIKPIANGRRLCEIFNEKPGPIIAELTDTLIRWQLNNPEGDLQSFLQSQK